MTAQPRRSFFQWRKPLRKFARARRGATAVEFALVAGPFFFLMFGIIETAIIYFAQTSLDMAMTRAQREIRTNAAQNKNITQSQFKQMVCDGFTQFVAADCQSRLWVDVDSFKSLAGVTVSPPMVNGKVTPADLSYSPGAPDDIVLIRLYYAWDVQTPMFDKLLGNMADGRRLLISQRLIRNEPS
ncbi:MAG: pilus assembly protein [Alphaproteobacteria bacterium]|nr:pilus assembly protein [Alphaproteobacteria bacterium]